MIASAFATISVLVSLCIMLLKLRDNKALENLRKYTATTFILFSTVLYIPIIFVFLKIFLVTQNKVDISLGIQIIVYFHCAFGIALLTLLIFYLKKTFNVFVPSKQIPWCRMFHHSAYLEIPFKALLACSIAFEIDASWATVVAAALFTIIFLSGISRLTQSPSYHWEVDKLLKF